MLPPGALAGNGLARTVLAVHARPVATHRGRCEVVGPAAQLVAATSSGTTLAQPLLILHAGPHKTGSTALQLRLITAREHLNANGWDYPLFGLSQFGHHRINAFLKGELADAGDVTEESLRSLAAIRRNVILSSEDLIYQPPEQLERLRGLLEGFRIQVVMFVRTPVQLWPSHWQELVKHGREESLLEYLGACFGVNTTINPVHMQPMHQAQRFAQVFGRKRVRLFCYNNIVAAGTDLFDFFIDKVLGLPPVLPWLPTVVINPSLESHTAEMLRCLNERFRREHNRSPGSDITAAYTTARAEIEAMPRYAEFRAAFEQHARTVTLDSDNDFLRRRDHQLLRLLGDRIENLAGPDQLYAQEYSRTIPYGTPYWADRFGFGDLVEEVSTRLAVPG
jgi:hypothetical protein